MPRRGARTAAVAIAAFGAASVWVSLGTLAAIQPDTRIRIIALPPLWLLALLVAGAAIAAWAARPSLERAAPLILSVLVWLPFLPGRVPAAFLIWQGPIEALVWLVVSAGVLYGTPLPRALSRVTLITNPRLAPWAAGFAAAVCYIGGSVALADRRPGGDEPHYLIIAESLRRDHDLRIQNNHDRLDYISFAPSQLDPHYVVRSTKGDIYSVHAPGLPALVVPAFALWGYAGASATVIAMTAAAGVLTWQAAWLLTASIGAAWLGWAAVVLTTPFFVHAFTVFPDGPGALGVSAGLWLLLQLEKRAPTNAVAVTLVATSLAVLPWLHSRLALPATALGLAIGWRLWQRRRSIADLVQFFAIPSLSALAWFGFFWVIWGTPNPNAPWGGMSNSVWRQVPPGLLGLIFHQQAGLISTAPVYVCAVIGVVGLARRHPRLAIELAAVTVPYALVVAGFAGWSGGFGGPARYLVAVLPLAALPTAWVWVAGGAVARTIALFLLLTSLAMLVPRIVMFRGSMVYAQHLSVDPLLAWAAHSVDLPAAFPDVRVAAAWQSVAVGLAVGGALLAPAAWVWRRPRPGPVATWIGVSLSAALWLMIVTTINWRLQHRDGIAAAKSQLAFVSQWNPGWQSTDIQWRPPYRVPAIQLLRRIDVPMTVVDGRANAPRAFVAASVGAGDYEVSLTGSRPLRGELTARIGDTNLPAEHWRLEDIATPTRTVRLHLPVAVGRLEIRGDAAAMASVEAIGLRVAALGEGPQRDAPPATRAARFGDVRLFFLDNRSYLEPSGFWTVGESRTTIVLDRGGVQPAGRITFSLQSGPVATSAELSTDGWTGRVSLGPHERQDVELPESGHNARTLSIRTGAMFLPVQHDPASRDFRHLGVWVEAH